MSGTSGSLANFIVRLPVVGRLVHIVSALYRLPEIRGFVYGELPQRVVAAHAAVTASGAEHEQATASALAAVGALEQSVVTRLAEKAAADVHLSQQHLHRAEAIEGHIRALSDLGYGLSRRLDDQTVRIRASEDQFSTVLDSLSTLNSRIDLEVAPLKQSFPVALREMRRSQMILGNAVRDLRSANANAATTIASQFDRLAARQAALESRQDDVTTIGIRVDGLADRQVALEGTQEAANSTLNRLVSDLDQEVDRLKVALAAQQERPGNEDLRVSVEFLLQRVEFVRKELMYELRYGSDTTGEKPANAEPRIADVAKVDAARNAPDGIRLNLGCGHLPLDGYINVDSRGLPGVDIIADVGRLPFADGEVAEITSAHVLEHFPQEQLSRKLLPYWKSILKRGGIFRAIVPDIDAMIGQYTAGEISYESMREVVYGSQDYDGDFHYNMFTPSSLSKLLEDAGFVNVTISATARRNGMCLEFEIHAKCD